MTGTPYETGPQDLLPCIIEFERRWKYREKKGTTNSQIKQLKKNCNGVVCEELRVKFTNKVRDIKKEISSTEVNKELDEGLTRFIQEISAIAIRHTCDTLYDGKKIAQALVRKHIPYK